MGCVGRKFTAPSADAGDPISYHVISVKKFFSLLQFPNLQGFFSGKIYIRIYHGYDCNKTQMYKVENIIFIIFQIFQMWLCFNAIYTQNTVQIVTTAAVTFFCALFAIVQMLEILKWYKSFGNCQVPLEFDINPKFTSYDIPLMIALIIFGFIMAFLGWKLYRQLAMFKTYLIYEMLLKLGLFFILGLALEASVTGLTFLIQIIGYRSFSLIWSVFVYNNFGQGLKDRLNQKDKEEPVFYLRLFKVYLKDRDSGFLTNIFKQSLKKYCKEVKKSDHFLPYVE
ncbi:hypothetical protein RhiirA4_448296 [Rhizophagus irregularis]|uniref:Uncharacterized protein n=1 Tax=Rhizophagus irregularis TaxID=588596 RepID=A0A2I1H8K2_9GLOM|nr:hypothetical protein RhiirA4_448296 [Rhizophagus irregularis]